MLWLMMLGMVVLAVELAVHRGWIDFSGYPADPDKYVPDQPIDWPED